MNAVTCIMKRRDGFRTRLPLDAAALGDLRSRLRTYLRRHDVPEKTAADIVLCVDEAVSNAILYSQARHVELTVRATADEVFAQVRDEGRGFSRRRSGCPELWNTRGRGLYLIQALMDDMRVDCSRGAAVSMWKRLKGSDAVHTGSRTG